VYYNAPTTSYESGLNYASNIGYETAPQYATYVEAAPISYAPVSHVTYAAAPAPSYAFSVPVHQQQQQLQLQQNSFAFDTIAPSGPSSSNIDGYGAPLAPAIG